MISQTEFKLSPKKRGFHLVTEEVLKHLPELPQSGLLHLFIKHTSAGITINENCDPDVLADFEMSFNHLVPEKGWNYIHTAEGPDDMPAHIKSALVGNSVTIPITNGQLNLGTWQGIYLCEFRHKAAGRSIVATAYS